MERYEIAAVEREIDTADRTYVQPLRDKLNLLRQKLAEELCPFKVGATVVSKRGHKAVVTKIYGNTWGTYEAYGNRILKSGAKGKTIKLYVDWEDWKKQEEVK